jgi:hypothetical protein
MAHPYKSAAHKSDPKWLDGVRKYARGGSVSEQRSYAFDDLRANAMYPRGDDRGTTNSAGPNRMTEEMAKESPYRGGRKVDTNMDTDTDFGTSTEVSTVRNRKNGRKRGGKV